jgi:hypothetical protein
MESLEIKPSDQTEDLKMAEILKTRAETIRLLEGVPICPVELRNLFRSED